MQVLHGPTTDASTGIPTPGSAMGDHSLLEEMYGNNWVSGTLGMASGAVTGFGQLINVYMTNSTLTTSAGTTVSDIGAELARRGGCVLTITGVPSNSTDPQKALVGQSTRIVGLNPAAAIVQVMAFSDGTTTAPAKATFVINGAPFSGTGAGYDSGGTASSTDSNTATLTLGYDWKKPSVPLVSSAGSSTWPQYPWPVALMPNLPLSVYAAGSNPNAFVFGGANPDYTAADYQHVLLAAQGTTSMGAVKTLPSMHRPALVQYWGATIGGGTLTADMARQIMMRPMGKMYFATSTGITFDNNTTNKNNVDHPDFTGSNQASSGLFDPINGPWDVDNDGDGVPDSVWVDLGFPVQTTSDGQLYKPLFAILCVDLDGRLNLNTHGSLAQCVQDSTGNYPYYLPTDATTDLASGTATTNPYIFAGSNTRASADAVPLPHGGGYGPAEINLRPLFVDATGGTHSDLYYGLLAGNTATGIAGRYGETVGAARPGRTGAESILFYNRNFQLQPYQNFNYANGSQTTAFGGPPDLMGALSVGLDLRGQPLWGMSRGACGSVAVNAWLNNAVNSPYELNLSPSASRGLNGTSGTDNPFSPSELERLLRPYDCDAPNLPSRLLDLSETTAGSVSTSTLLAKRGEVTTESWDVPCPPVALSRDMLLGDLDPTADATMIAHLQQLLAQAPPKSVVDSLAFLYIKKSKNAAMTLAQATGFITQYDSNGCPYFPLELLAGRKMDLNRAFSSGTFTSTSGNELVPAKDAAGNDLMNIPFDYLNIGAVGGSNTTVTARQVYARQLYLLAMLLVDGRYRCPLTGTETLTDDQRKFLTARRIAQWAVNVACFRTNDSIMVPFEFDAKPFTVERSGGGTNSWDVDDNIATDETKLADPVWRGVVWGCKRPELLLTEASAFHDRRVADTKFDDNNQKKRTDKDPNTGGPADKTLDQPRIPQGSAFFEVYCTANRADTAAPPDLYSYDSANNVWRLDLGRMAPTDSSHPLRYPVWRMVITQSTKSANHPEYNDVAGRLAATPDTCSLEPGQYHTPLRTAGTPGTSTPDPDAPGQLSLLINENRPAVLPNVPIERIVWFATQAPTIPANPNQSSATNCHYDYDRIYYNRSGAVTLAGGEYCVIGPRPTTYVGSKDPATNGNQLGIPSPQKIVLATQQVQWNAISATVTGYPPSTPNTTQIKQPYGMVVAGGVVPADPSAWASSANKPWISPMGDPNNATFWPSTSPAAADHFGGYGIGISISEPLFSNQYYREPREKNPATGETDAYGDLNQTDASKHFPDLTEDGDATHLKAGKPLSDETLWKTGTTQNYKTVFLQRLANPSAPYDPVTNPYRTVDWMPIDLTVFNGEDKVPSDSELSAVNLTKQTWDPADDNPSPDAIPFQTRERGQTGQYSQQDKFINIWAQNTQPPQSQNKNGAPGDACFPFDLVNSLGYINTTYQATKDPKWRTKADGDAAGYGSEYYGDPLKPFPWVPFNYRPFVSQMELPLVPSTHPARLPLELGYGFANSAGDPYQTAALPASLPYPCLLNFFESVDAGGAISSKLYRLLDYVYVPSHFVGTEILANPKYATGGGTSHVFHPPFNAIPTYREPGRINLNTVYGQDVFTGLMNENSGARSDLSWSGFATSRRGAGNSGGILDTPTALCPTEFPFPFRSSTTAQLAALPVLTPSKGIDATLLRPDPTATTQPLFKSSSSAAGYNDPSCNPYFRYQALQRLGNLGTTRSNVFAVWVTVGYFEVEPAPTTGKKHTDGSDWTQADYKAVYPDGYQLGAELGIDTGKVVRHRAFYIIDRTLPVGFQRGKDLNSDKAILVNRFIE